MQKPEKILRVLIVEDTPERQDILQKLFRDHAWVLVHTADRAVRLLENFPFDLIALDYNIAGNDTGEVIAKCISGSKNRKAHVIIHSMNPTGRARMSAFLPDADIVPISKMIKSNAVFKKIREQLLYGADIDWASVFRKAERPVI